MQKSQQPADIVSYVPSYRDKLAQRFSGVTDQNLMAKFIDGDQRAFAELVERYRTKLLRLFFFIYHVQDPQKRLDLTQDVFAKVARYATSFNQEKKFSPWIYQIGHNEGKNWLRHFKRGRHTWESFEAIVEKTGNPPKPSRFMGPLEECLASDLSAQINNAVDSLPEEQRRTYLLREVDGLQYEEIAQITNANIGTVKSRLHRAKNGIADHIKPYLD